MGSGLRGGIGLRRSDSFPGRGRERESEARGVLASLGGRAVAGVH